MRGFLPAYDTVESRQLLFFIDGTKDLEEHRLYALLLNNNRLTLGENGTAWDVAVGPRMEMVSGWSSNVVCVLREGGIRGVNRVEQFVCYQDIPENFDDLTQSVIWRQDLDTTVAQYPWSLTVPFPQPTMRLKDGTVPIEDIPRYNKHAQLKFDTEDVAFYQSLYEKLGRPATVAELHDLSNCNSEHSRHHLFRAHFVTENDHYDGIETIIQQSMMDLIRLPLSRTKSTNSVLAMCDNASAIKGWNGLWLRADLDTGLMRRVSRTEHITFTAETHNFPTGIAPFEGATTGVGGRIRDNQAIGRGGFFVAGTAGYCVGRIHCSSSGGGGQKEGVTSQTRPGQRWSPIQILLQASDGASDYGNKIGEPLIVGFTRAGADNQQHEWLKPIMFSGGIGRVHAMDVKKQSPVAGLKIVRVGGPTYRIGIGGGAASSSGQSSSDQLLSAVQRGDAQQQNRMDRWLRTCLSMDCNPIRSIHDQGAGGMGNVTKEIAEGVGAVVTLSSVELGDDTLSNAEIWVAESQEQNTALIHPNDIDLAKSIARGEGVGLCVIGRIQDSGRIVVHRREDVSSVVVNLPLDCINPPRKTYRLPATPEGFSGCGGSATLTTNTLTAFDVLAGLRHIDVCSKRFLTTKVDRSVGGLVVQQQCVGPHHTPLADVAVVAHDFFGTQGAATAIGEQPIVMLQDLRRGVKRAVAEMITNLVWAPITSFIDIKCSVNWMWPAGTPEGKSSLLLAVKTISDVMCQLGIAIDGGKDSVSMTTTLLDGTRVDSPPQVVVSGYAACTDITRVITPGFKSIHSSAYLVMCTMDELPTVFATLQKLIRDGIVLAGHDVSDGGLITCVAEMCFASECNTSGFIFSTGMLLKEFIDKAETADAAVVIECERRTNPESLFSHHRNIDFLGCVTDGAKLVSDELTIPVRDLRQAWEWTATQLEKQQTEHDVAEKEHEWILSAPPAPKYHLEEEQLKRLKTFDFLQETTARCSPPRVAVIRGEGSNGDREMAAALYMAGFEVFDMPTTDLTSSGGRFDNLDEFSVVVFVGGFTYSDVLGAATGWRLVLTENQRARNILDRFRRRPDTLVLGVCNGCQLLTSMGWVSDVPFEMQRNLSGRFESRFVSVKISSKNKDNEESPWFKGLDGTRIGVWAAHGEGRFPADVQGAHPVLNYVDQDGDCTMQYPLNPNGSPHGLAGVTSEDGRVLAIMPHPERCVKKWQLPWMPEWLHATETHENYAPWILMFRNAYEWCCLSQRQKFKMFYDRTYLKCPAV